MSTQQEFPDTPTNPKKGFVAPKAIAVILAILLALFAVVGLIGFNIWRVLFNPPVVKQALSTEVVSSEIVPATLEVFSEWRAGERVKNKESLSGVNEPDIVLLMSFLQANNWRDIKQLLVTDDFVIQIVSASVDGLYAWVDSDDIWPDINWDMTLLKERMDNENGVDAIMVAYSTLPIATDADIADFEQRLSKVPPGVEVLYNLCQFPNPWHEDQVGDYVNALNAANDNIPVIFNFSTEFGASSDDLEANLIQLKDQLRLVRFIAISGWIFALILLLLILVLKVRSRRSLGQYIGIPLIIGGALSALIALIGQPVIIGVVTNNLLAATSDFARQEITDSLKHLTSLFFQPLLIQGTIFGGLGIILVAAIFIKKSKKTDIIEEKTANLSS